MKHKESDLPVSIATFPNSDHKLSLQQWVAQFHQVAALLEHPALFVPREPINGSSFTASGLRSLISHLYGSIRAIRIRFNGALALAAISFPELTNPLSPF